MPIVPLEPVFEAIEIDPEAINPDIPTFHIVSDEEEAEEDESGIKNTEQTGKDNDGDSSVSGQDEEDLTIRNTEQDDESGIKNTEQESTAYLINNDAENK